LVVPDSVDRIPAYNALAAWAEARGRGEYPAGSKESPILKLTTDDNGGRRCFQLRSSSFRTGRDKPKRRRASALQITSSATVAVVVTVAFYLTNLMVPSKKLNWYKRLADMEVIEE